MLRVLAEADKRRLGAHVLVLALLALAVGCETTHPCEQEIRSLCGMEKPGGPSEARCIQKFFGKLTDGCRKDLVKIRPNFKEALSQ